MPSDYTVTSAPDGRVVVVLHPECKISRDEIMALLQELGFDPLKVTFVEPEQASECDNLQDTPVIFPVDDATCDLPEIGNAAQHCGNAGGQVIVVLGPGSSYEGLHPIAEKYGTQCGWSPDQLKNCISGSADAPSTSSGKPATRPGARQVDC